MIRKHLSLAVILCASVLCLGVAGAVLAQDTVYDVITVKNAKKLEQITQITDADKYMEDASIAFSPDSKLLAYVQDGKIQLWDVAKGEATTVGDMSYPAWLVFINDGKTLFATPTTFLSSFESWDLETNKALPQIFPTSSVQANSTVINSDGSVVAAVGDAAVTLFDTATGETVATLSPDSGQVAISGDKKTVAIGDNNTKMELWDVATGKVTFTLNSPSKAYGNPVFSSDSTLVAGCNLNDGVDIWEVASGKLVKSFRSASCGRGVFSPDDTLFVTGFGDMSVYNVAKGGNALFKLEDASNVAFSPDGTLIATVSAVSSAVTIWGIKK